MTRCDLAFAFSQLSQFLHCPGEAHMAAAERVLRYIRGTHDKGLICVILALSVAIFSTAGWTAILLLIPILADQ